MPKKSNISVLERRGWLDRHEQGTSLDVIAKETGRDQRTVNTNVDKARGERDVQVVRRELLREALRSHQRDLLDFLSRLKQSVHTPQIAFKPLTAPDFGLEGLLDAKDLPKCSQVDLGPPLSFPESALGRPILDITDHEISSAVTVLRDSDGPTRILMAEEGSKLWKEFKNHIGGRDPLWGHISRWQLELLAECQDIAVLNRAIMKKVEEDFGLPVLWGTEHQLPHLSAPLVPWARNHLTKVALGVPASDVTAEVRKLEGGRLETVNGQWIAVGLADTKQGKAQLRRTIEALIDIPEVRAVALSYRGLQARCAKVHLILDDYLLLHYVPGRCSICRKLGA